MIRKFNYTGRKKINQAAIKISVNDDLIRYFDVSVDITEYNLPDHAKVYIEPYFKSSFMRFCLGTVGKISLPEDRYLIDIPQSEVLLFRVKIVDESKKIGRLLALADRIKPKNLQDSNANKQSILWIDDSRSLGQEIFRLSFDQDFPTLEVNKDIKDIRHVLKRDELFFSLVYPSVVREIAKKIIYELSAFEEGDDSWQSKWLSFIRKTLFVSYLPDETQEEQEEWINDVVSAFCRKYKIRKKFENNNPLINSTPYEIN